MRPIWMKSIPLPPNGVNKDKEIPVSRKMFFQRFARFFLKSPTHSLVHMISSLESIDLKFPSIILFFHSSFICRFSTKKRKMSTDKFSPHLSWLQKTTGCDRNALIDFVHKLRKHSAGLILFKRKKLGTQARAETTRIMNVTIAYTGRL